MKRIFLLFIFLLPFISKAQTCNGNLVWSDEFDSTMLDLNKWAYQIGDGCPNLCGWGNSELEYYTSNGNNTYISSGVLNLKVIKQNAGSASFTSSKLAIPVDISIGLPNLAAYSKSGRLVKSPEPNLNAGTFNF